MKTTIIAAALAAALALPAIAADAPDAVVVIAAADDAQKARDDARIEAQKAREAARAETQKAREDARIEAQKARDAARVEADKARAEADRIRIDAQSLGEWAHEFAAEMQGSMAFMFSDRVGRGKVVKGAPYSAEVVTENNQTLSDGNVITHRNLSRIYRDGDGRTRQETWREDKLRSVYISDPAGRVAYTILPDHKMAIAVPRIETRIETHTAPRARSSSSSESKVETKEERKIVVRTIDGDGGPGVREEVRVQVFRMGDGEGKEKEVIIAPRAPVPPIPPTPPIPGTPPFPGAAPTPPLPMIMPMPGVQTLRFESSSKLGKGVTTSLAARDFDGVKADGKSTTWTIPAGQIGNRNAINVVSETFYSPELQVTVYTRYNDPRTGESIYRLANIKRGEPSADLFKVPEGFTVKGRGKREAPEAKGGNSPG